MIRIRPTTDGYLLLADGRRAVLVEGEQEPVINSDGYIIGWKIEWHTIPIIEETSTAELCGMTAEESI